MKSRKIKIGVSINEKIVNKLNRIVKSSDYLNTNRSELVDVLLTAYFSSNANHMEKARELIIRKRKGLLN